MTADFLPITTGDSADYFQRLARKDYFQEGGESPGRWLGSAAKYFGLHGDIVKTPQLKNALAGCSPHGSRALIQLQKKKDVGRRLGTQLHVSVPKSVSVLWALGTPTQRRIIFRAFEARH